MISPNHNHNHNNKKKISSNFTFIFTGETESLKIDARCRESNNRTKRETVSDATFPGIRSLVDDKEDCVPRLSLSDPCLMKV